MNMETKDTDATLDSRVQDFLENKLQNRIKRLSTKKKKEKHKHNGVIRLDKHESYKADHQDTIVEIKSKNVLMIKKKRDKQITPKVVLKNYTYKDYFIFYSSVTATKTEKLEYLEKETDKNRQEYLETKPELKERFDKSVDRFVQKSKITEYQTEIEKVQKETIEQVKQLLKVLSEKESDSRSFEEETDNKPFETIVKENLKELKEENKKNVGDKVIKNLTLSTNNKIQPFELAIQDIQKFREATRKTAQIKRKYIVACEIIKTLTNLTGINLIELLEIGTMKITKKSVENELIQYGINEMIKKIKQLRENIVKENQTITTENTNARSILLNFKKDTFDLKLAQSQTPDFKEVNWSKLTLEQKHNRIESYIVSTLRSLYWNAINAHAGEEFTRNYTMPEEISRIIQEQVQVFLEETKTQLENKQIQYRNIKWKKQKGIIETIKITPAIEFTNEHLEQFIKDVPEQTKKIQSYTKPVVNFGRIKHRRR